MRYRKRWNERTSLFSSQDVDYFNCYSYNPEACTPNQSLDANATDFHGFRLLLALLPAWTCSFLAALDSTMTSTLSATIASEFDSLAVIAWLGSAYLLAMATVQPLSEKMSDVFGRPAGLILCCLSFAAGNTICGLAESKTHLVIGRVTAGIGAGGLNSIQSFVSTDLIPQRQRGVWQGFSMLVYAFGLGLGPLVGGCFNDSLTFSWRSAFLALTPLTLLCAIGVWRFVPDQRRFATNQNSKRGRFRQIDFLGGITLTSALALLLWALNLTESRGSASSLPLIMALPISGAIFILFITIEVKYAKEPIISFRILRNRTVWAVSLTGFFDSMAIYSLLYYVPLYLQVRGYKTSEVGIRLLPESVGAVVGALSTSMVMRSTEYCGKLKLLFLCLFLVSSGVFAASCSLTSHIALFEVGLFANGAGYGGMITSLTLNVLCAVEHEMQTVTMSVFYTFRSIGATVGIAISSMIFRQVLASQLPPPEIFSIATDDNQGGHTVEWHEHHHDVWEGIFSMETSHNRDPYLYALQSTFILSFAFAVAGLVSGLFARNLPLSNTTIVREKPDLDHHHHSGPGLIQGGREEREEEEAAFEESRSQMYIFRPF